MPVKFRDCKTVTDIKKYSALDGKGHWFSKKVLKKREEFENIFDN